jgi:SAM-dependent methyltransferase
VANPDRARLRATFDEDAERYDRARPGYPPLLFDDLAELTGIGPGCRVLEIGPGTGQATLPLAERGCQIVAVELGEGLASLTRRKLSAFGNLRVETSAFETWPLPAEPFDVVVAATAFHWIDPEFRVAKSADALRPGGALAVLETHHVAGDDAGFFDRSQECYLRFDPDATPGLRLPTAADVPMQAPDIAASSRFGPIEFRRYVWDRTYSTAEYVDLLLTYSDHLALPDSSRTGLLDCIARLIDNGFQGRIRKRYLTQLCVARVRS